MNDLWTVALLHSIGSLAIIGLGIRAWVRERDTIAACLRLALGVFFLRYAAAVWRAAGVDIGPFAFVGSTQALFATGFCMYILFLVADRDRWRRKSHADSLDR